MKPLRTAGLVVALAALWPALISTIAFLAQLARYRHTSHHTA